jgi:hypothetical protein
MILLAKIHKAKYINDMFEKEYLYFNSLKDFKANPWENSGRLDPKELNVSNYQLKTLTIKVNEKDIHLHELLKNFSAQLYKSIHEPKINCCALHWIEIEPNELAKTYNKELLQLGDKTLIIYDLIEFLVVLDNSINEMGYKFSRKKVTYYDPKVFDGEISLHHKDLKYSWQNEYRILISPTENKPICIPIPGLKKISTIIDTKDLESLRIEIIN